MLGDGKEVLKKIMEPAIARDAEELDTLHKRMGAALKNSALTHAEVENRQHLIAELANQYMLEAMGKTKWNDAEDSSSSSAEEDVERGIAGFFFQRGRATEHQQFLAITEQYNRTGQSPTTPEDLHEEDVLSLLPTLHITDRFAWALLCLHLRRTLHKTEIEEAVGSDGMARYMAQPGEDRRFWFGCLPKIVGNNAPFIMGISTYALMLKMSVNTMQIMLDETAVKPWQPWLRKDAGEIAASHSLWHLGGHLFSREFMSVFALLTVFAEGMALPYVVRKCREGISVDPRIVIGAALQTTTSGLMLVIAWLYMMVVDFDAGFSVMTTSLACAGIANLDNMVVSFLGYLVSVEAQFNANVALWVGMLALNVAMFYPDYWAMAVKAVDGVVLPAGAGGNKNSTRSVSSGAGGNGAVGGGASEGQGRRMSDEEIFNVNRSRPVAAILAKLHNLQVPITEERRPEQRAGLTEQEQNNVTQTARAMLVLTKPESLGPLGRRLEEQYAGSLGDHHDVYGRFAHEVAQPYAVDFYHTAGLAGAAVACAKLFRGLCGPGRRAARGAKKKTPVGYHRGAEES